MIKAINLRGQGPLKVVRDHDTPLPGFLHLEFETGVVVQIPIRILEPGYRQNVAPGRSGIILYTRGNAPARKAGK